MNRELIALLSLLIFITACSEKEEVDSNLYTNLPPDTAAIDTIITNVKFNFELDTIYENKVEEFRPINVERTKSKRNNTFDKTEFGRKTQKESDTVFNVEPFKVEAEPFIAYIYHPKPVVAGEFSSDKNSGENVQTLGVDQGLPGLRVVSVIEDQFGFMWFGLATGLVRYDGNYFYIYTEENGLISDNINELFLDSSGKLWISTDKGIMIYNGTAMEVYNSKNGLLADLNYSFIEDKDENVWFASENNGICKYDGEYFYQYTKEQGLKSNLVFCIGFDHQDRLFISSGYTSPDMLDGNNIINFTNRGEGFYGSTMTINTFNDKNGDLWTVSYNGGVRHIVSDSLSLSFLPPTGIPYLSMSDGLQDQSGNFWFATSEAGISYFDGDKFVGYTEDQGLNSNIVFCLEEDQHGNIWAGTNQGVCKIIPESFKTITPKDGLAEKTITNLSITKDGYLLISTYASGLYTYDGESFDHYFGGLIVFDAAEDSIGNIIVGSHQYQTAVVKPAIDDSLYFESSLNLNTKGAFNPWGSRDIEVAANGDVWIAGDLHGLYCLKLSEDRSRYESIETYTIKSGLNSKRQNEIMIDSQGTLWISYRGFGISKAKGNTIEHFTTKSGLPSNYINQFYEDSKGQIWMASVDGLILYENDNYHLFTKEDGLSDNNTTSIIEDNNGRYWVGSRNGMNLLTKKGKGPAEYGVTMFTTKDGLSATDFTAKAVVLDSNNTIWWATSQYLVSLNLNEFDHFISTPEVNITNILLAGEHINFNDIDDTANPDLSKAEIGKAKPFFNLPEKMRLLHHQNNISITYSSLKGNASHRLRYRYFLDGFHQNWTKESNETQANFTNLSPGKYTFKVQAKLINHEWGPVSTFEFEIKPPFWQKWWFRICMFFLLAYVVYLIVKLRNKQLLKRQEELEETVRQRTHKVEQQKHIIEEKQTEILDSINYAQRIQRTLLATDQMLSEYLGDYFVFFQPKDVVSGDFYWATPTADNSFIMVNADSTGHGVPGAIMSMLNISCLEKAVENAKLTEPADILNHTRVKIIETLAKDGSAEGGKDGMDCCLIKLNPEKTKLTFAAAHNGIWIIRKDELIEFKADKMPIGKHAFDDQAFTQHEIQLEKGDIIYTFTDGYPDQFGGEKGKKFKYKSLKKLLLEISPLDMKAQQAALDTHFNSWKGDLEQLDDVCIIGVRV